MEAILERCCGLDVHKREVVACLLVGATHERPRRDVRRFATLTVSLRELRDWLVSAGCTHVAMESTGPYWRPVFNLLEGAVTVVLANARHIKNVPGRKTDVRDCEWIAQLLRCGLIRGSFIPPAAIRELRDLTRYRRQLVEEGTRARNRVQKLLEHANVKLGSVLSDVFGASGRAMLAALSAGPESPETLARLARGRVRATQSEVTQALDGVVGEHHRLLLRQMLAHLADLERRVAELDACIQGRFAPLAAAVARVQTIPGIKAVAAAAILAEIGTDMSPFPTDAHLASWAGLCPGNHQFPVRRRRSPIALRRLGKARQLAKVNVPS